jgi:hypothetical protein
LINSIGTIGTDAASILVSDVNVASLTDMFRLFRINSFQVHFQPATGTGTASVQIPSGFIGFTPYGAITPTSYADFETPLVSKQTLPFLAGGTAPFTSDQATQLSLSNKDLPVLQGPGGGWLATQQDGTQLNYGSIFWALAATTAANTINYLAQYYFDISFKDLLDPTLISANMQKHFPTGYPDHWILNGGDAHAIAPYQRSAVMAKRQQLGLPPIMSDRLLHPSRPSSETISGDRSTVDDVGAPSVASSNISLWSGPDPDFDKFISKCKLFYFNSLANGTSPTLLGVPGSGVGAPTSQ